jgi:uncharacterized protein with PIN domain
MKTTWPLNDVDLAKQLCNVIDKIPSASQEAKAAKVIAREVLERAMEARAPRCHTCGTKHQ